LEVSETLLIFAAQLGQDCIRQLTIFRGFHLLSDIERPCEELDLFAGFLLRFPIQSLHQNHSGGCLKTPYRAA